MEIEGSLPCSQGPATSRFLYIILKIFFFKNGLVSEIYITMRFSIHVFPHVMNMAHITLIIVKALAEAYIQA